MEADQLCTHASIPTMRVAERRMSNREEVMSRGSARLAQNRRVGVKPIVSGEVGATKSKTWEMKREKVRCESAQIVYANQVDGKR